LNRLRNFKWLKICAFLKEIIRNCLNKNWKIIFLNLLCWICQIWIFLHFNINFNAFASFWIWECKIAFRQKNPLIFSVIQLPNIMDMSWEHQLDVVSFGMITLFPIKAPLFSGSTYVRLAILWEINRKWLLWIVEYESKILLWSYKNSYVFNIFYSNEMSNILLNLFKLIKIKFLISWNKIRFDQTTMFFIKKFKDLIASNWPILTQIIGKATF
jgi:hypothetical protein